MNTFRQFRHDDTGVTLVEYGIALALAIIVGLTAVFNLGTEVNTQMGETQVIMQ